MEPKKLEIDWSSHWGQVRCPSDDNGTNLFVHGERQKSLMLITRCPGCKHWRGFWHDDYPEEQPNFPICAKSGFRETHALCAHPSLQEQEKPNSISVARYNGDHLTAETLDVTDLNPAAAMQLITEIDELIRTKTTAVSTRIIE